MIFIASLFALLVFSITGSPIEVRNSTITLPMTRRPTFYNVTDILRNDEARVAAFMEYSTHGRRANVPLSNMDVGYFVSVNIGFPPITYNLIVDSSNSITWVGAKTPYTSLSGDATRDPVAVVYNFGFFQGTIYKDRLTFTDELTITGMPIGVAYNSRHISLDGVLGIGPRASSRGTLQYSLDDTIPSVTDYLFAQGTIGQPLVGIFFQPFVENLVNDGELAFGEADPGKCTSNIRYTDITTAPGSPPLYWGINQRIAYGDIDLMPSTAGSVDCGATFIYIKSDAYERYKFATGATVNVANGLLQISPQQYNFLDVLKFYIFEDTYYGLTPNAQIWPRSLNYVMSGGDNDIFLVVRRLSSAASYDFVMGYVFLQRFYTVFDAGRSQIGFAETPFTQAITN